MNSEIEGFRAKHLEIALHSEPRLRRLFSNGEIEKVAAMLEGRRRIMPFFEEPTPLTTWIFGAVSYALHEPDVAETMTASERRRLAKTIIDSSNQLFDALEVFKGDHGYKYPFQGPFDKLALEVAISEEERLAEAGVPMDEDTSHRCRFAVYHLLMDKMEWLFSYIVGAAEDFAETETIIKKPNDPNASRLYFIRTLNRRLCLEFRAPCRAVNLALASLFFNCDDLDEAAISKLAPFYKPIPYPLPPEHVDFLKHMYAMQGKPNGFDEMIRHVEAESKWGMGRESSAEEK